jgi:hypothetical protein
MDILAQERGQQIDVFGIGHEAIHVYRTRQRNQVVQCGSVEPWTVSAGARSRANYLIGF